MDACVGQVRIQTFIRNRQTQSGNPELRFIIYLKNCFSYRACAEAPASPSRSHLHSKIKSISRIVLPIAVTSCHKMCECRGKTIPLTDAPVSNSKTGHVLLFLYCVFLPFHTHLLYFCIGRNHFHCMLCT